MQLRFSTMLPVLLCALAPSAVSAGELTGLSHRSRLYDSAAHGSNVYVVGHPGLVLRSSDQGQHFASVPVPTQDALFSIDFNKAGLGAIVGRSGLVLLSNDGGATWTKTNALAGGSEGEEKPHLFAVDVLESGAIVAVGDFATIVHSSDRGKTWQKRSFDPTDPGVGSAVGHGEGIPSGDSHENEGFEAEARLTAVSFGDDLHGFIVGEFGMTLGTEDGGLTWKRQHSGTDVILYAVHAADAKHAVIAGSDGTILETQDTGLSWGLVPTPKKKHLFGVWVSGARTVAVGSEGTVLVRTKGESFVTVKTGLYVWLSSVLLLDDQHAVVAGGRGQVLSTRDGGRTFGHVLGE